MKKRQQADETLTQLAGLKADYSAQKKKLKDLELDLAEEKSKERHIKSLLSQADEELAAAEEEIDSDPLPEGAQPKARLQRRDNLHVQMSHLNAELNAQKQFTQKAQALVSDVERRMFALDRDMSLLVERLQDSNEATKLLSEIDKERAERLANMEKKRVVRWEKEQKSAIEKRVSQIQELSRTAASQVEVTKALHEKAAERIQGDLENTWATAHGFKAARDSEHQHRTSAVLELKNDISANRAQLATNSAQIAQRVTAAKQQLENEKDSMVEQGLNPYAEFRRKEFDADALARETRMINEVTNSKLQLSQRLEREQETSHKAEVKELAHKHHEKRFRESQGRKVVEARNRDYITSITIGAREILDPSGKASRVDPSQITEIPDSSFGLGKSSRIPPETMARITEKIRQGLKVDPNDLGEYQRLVNGLLPSEERIRIPVKGSIKENFAIAAAAAAGTTQAATVAATSGQTASTSTRVSTPTVALTEEEKTAALARREQERRLVELQGLANITGPMPGLSKAAVDVNIPSEFDRARLIKIAQEEAGGTVKISEGYGDKSPKYKIPHQSKFETNSFDRAKDRQKRHLEEGSTQVAGGRVFRGQSFVSKPSELLFKDFEIGKVYKKRFTLTNASYTFNSFKLLALTDDIIDFFVITYEKPGRMSAGVSCSIDITFSPQINKEIHSFIRLQTETGPVEIPLTCLYKLCAPKVKNIEIDFGVVVVGQKITLPMHIVNTEALASTFSIVRMTNNSSGDAIVVEEPGDLEDLEAEQGQTRRQSTVAAAESPLPQILTENVEIGGNGEEGAGSESALNAAELSARVTRILTAVKRRKKKDDPFSLSFAKSDGEVPGYGNCSVEVVCAPLEIGECVEQFLVTFHGVVEGTSAKDEEGAPIRKEQVVSVRMVGEELPIYVDDPTVDMKCTLFGRIYRKRLEVRNRGQISYRVNINIPSKLKDFIEVNPTMMFVQSKGSQPINIKFAPSAAILRKFAHFSLPYEGFLDAALMTIPVQIEVVNQELPVYFILRSDVCPSNLDLSIPELNYGGIYVNQQSTLDLVIKNTSMQAQKAAFVRLPKEITVQPNDGFLALLPNETVTARVSFCPFSAIEYDLALALQTSLNDTYNLKVVAKGVECPIAFSATTIVMRTTFPGERVVESIMATNTTRRTQCFEVVTPARDCAWLKISPSIVELPPGQSVRLEVEYLPPEDLREQHPRSWYASTQERNPEAKDSCSLANPLTEWVEDSGWVFAKGVFGEVQWVCAGAGTRSSDLADVSEQPDSESQDVVENAAKVNEMPLDLPDDEWGVSACWRCPVFIRPKSSAKQLHEHSEVDKPFPFFICVEATVVVPQLEIDENNVDFGQLSLGTRRLKVLKLRNLGREPVQLYCSGLNAVGPFTVLNTVRSMSPGESKNLLVECLPLRPGLYIEVFELSASEDVGGHRIRVTLRTEGLKPTVELEALKPPPTNWAQGDGIVDFGSIVNGDVATQSFVVANRSNFAVDIRIDRTVSIGLSAMKKADFVERTAAGLPIFSYRPERVVVPPNSTLPVEVVFRPDRARFLPFREDLTVQVGDTAERLHIGLFGRCWNRQVFVIPANPSDEPFAKNQQLAPAAYVEDLLASSSNPDVRNAALEARKAVHVKTPAFPPICLEFPDPYAPDVDPKSFVEVSAGGGGSKGKGPAGGISGRQQTRRVLVCNAKMMEGRPGSNNGTFEVVFDAATKESGLWTVSVEKGGANPGMEVPVDFSCTLPAPRGVGGLSVGSWKNFKADVVLKGGWAPAGESDEQRIPVVLKAFLSL